MMKPLQVGLLGMGTVGNGTWTVLRRNEEEITRRAGRPIRITWIAEHAIDVAREKTRGAQGINLHRGTWHGVLTPLHAPGLFAVVDRIGTTPNLEEFRYPQTWTVLAV